MSLQHLHFFDKRGNSITPNLSDGVFKFNVFFEPTSVGLFASEHIFIFEEVYHEHEGSTNSIGTNAYVPLIIRIMRFMYNSTDKITNETFLTFFPSLQIENNYIFDFVQKNTRYISTTFDGFEVLYNLTAEGISYLEEYNAREEEILLNNERKTLELTRPRSNYDLSKNEDTFLYFRWKRPDIYDDNIFLYYIDQSDPTIYYEGDKSLCLDTGKKMPGIVPVYSSNLEADLYDNPDWKNWYLPYRFDDGRGDSWTTINSDGSPNSKSHRLIRSEVSLNQKPFQLNFAMTSDTEGSFVRMLDVFTLRTTISSTTGLPVSNAYKVAEITFFGEVIGEDERLKSLLENFGRQIDENDSYIFRDTDTDEDYPDYIKINEKRKELLLVGEEIYNYIGSYKAFVNAMKFFGYQDLRLKEYFVNVLLSNPINKTIYYTSVEIPLDLKVNFNFTGTEDFNEVIFGGLINNKIYAKSSRFGLYYDLNKETGEIDDYGFPIIEDSFNYTNEEILIKLYGLKKVLQKYYLPHHARIIDITGEGIYFAKYKMNVWTNQNHIISLKYDTNPDFTVTPSSGYIKQLDHLLNIFKQESINIENIDILNIDDKLENIYNKTLSEYIKNSETDFIFDKEITLDIIKRFYPDYNSLKKAVYDQLTNSNCNNTYVNYNKSTSNPIFLEKKLSFDSTGIPTYKTIQPNIVNEPNTNIQNIDNLSGQPVLLQLTPNKITWNDLDLRYDYLENELGPVDINDQELKKIASEDIERFDWQHMSNSDVITLKRLLWSGSQLCTWENLGYTNSQWMQWHIEHENKSYCYTVEGLIEDIKNILLFLPQSGKYNVKLSMRDSNNLPRITLKKSSIEVLKENPDFIAFGRFINQGNNWSDYNTTKYDDFLGVWDYSSFCNINTTWDDSKIIWDDMEYPMYQSQYFTKELESTTISECDEEHNIIILDGIDFALNYQEYGSKKWRDVLVLERDPEEIPTNRYISINNINNKTITLDGLYDIKIGEKINLFKHVITNQMVIADQPRGKIDVSNDFSEALEIDRTFNLLHGSNLERETYLINDVAVDYTTNLIHITSQDDGSLYDIPHNQIELRGDDFIFRVVSCTKNIIDNTTDIIVIDPSGNLRDVQRKGISNYKAEWGIFSGRYVFDINKVTIDKNKTIVSIQANNNIANITTTFLAKWAKDYDFDWSERYNNTKSYYWDNFTNITFDQSSNQTWGMMEYHGTPITGFKITEINRSGIIKFNGTPWSFNIPQTIEPESMWQYLSNLLNNDSSQYVKDFNYYVIDNNYIQAISKILGINSLINIESSGNVTCELNTYPKTNFQSWEKMFYSGYNNPAFWNYLKQGELDENKFWALTGAFNLTDTFITSNDMTLPIFTTLFIVFSLPNDISVNNQYEWELIEEQKQKLLSKSNYRYIIWNFIDKGIYTIKLKFTDSNGNIKNYEKKSWIYIK